MKKPWYLRFLDKRWEKKLASLKDNERVLEMARRLLNELEVQGYDTSGVAVSQHVDLWVFSRGELQVENTTRGWSVKGKLKESE